MSDTENTAPQGEEKAPEVQAPEVSQPEAKPYGVKIFICAMEEGMPHELATAHLRSKVPFTKEKIEGFIASDDFTNGLQQSIKDEGKEVSIFYMIANDPVAIDPLAIDPQEAPTVIINKT